LNSVLISSNLILVLFLFLIFIGETLTQTTNHKLINYYKSCILAAMAGIIFETICYSLEGNQRLYILILITKLLSDIFIDVNIFIYMISIYTALEMSKKSFPIKLKKLIIISLSINVLLQIILGLLGKTFTIENGFIINGSIFFIPMIIQIICFYAVFVNALRIGGIHKRNHFVLVAMALIPYCSLFILYKFSALKHFYIFLVFAYMIIYISYESTFAINETTRANIYKELSYTDFLTGFLNHTGYQKYINKLPAKEKIGVIFCDVNSLKSTNDTLGHEEGDKLIKKVAEILKEVLSGAILCRVSGDEFICFSKIDSEDAYKEKCKILKNTFFDKGRIASCGYATGRGESIVEIVKTAEKEMYIDKAKYYKETGRNRRRS